MAHKDREAKNAYQREWYAKNREKHVGWVNRSRRARREAMVAKVAEIKSAPCTDCGQTFDPVCMDFDHLPGSGKEEIVSKMVAQGFSWDRIKREIDKCELVCSNCHRIRTRDRLIAG